jgi:hypothetical protein
VTTDAEILELRAHAQDLANRPDWAGMLALEPRLRADVEFWVGIWAPLLAIAAAHERMRDGRRYLDEAVAGGFSQPEMFDGELEQYYAADPDWPAVVAAMAANVSPPRVELLSWPKLSLAHPVRLAAIALDRVDPLRERLPEPASSAWTTAVELTRWVSLAWDHAASAHVDQRDALQVLDRVAAGERFACREYTIVLSQALNVQRIPARSVVLLRPGHHTGFGRGHAVTEAWIDDLGAWVVLDGQNGMYWVDGDRPLGLPDLVGPAETATSSRSRPNIVNLAGKPVDPDSWWPYFHTVGPTGVVLTAPPYAPILESTIVIETEQLRTDPAGTHPDLHEVGIGIADVNGRPAVVPVTRHPYAIGFLVTGLPPGVTELSTGHPRLAPEEPWPIPDLPAGDHTVVISTLTPYGTFGAHPLRLRVR